MSIGYRIVIGGKDDPDSRFRHHAGFSSKLGTKLARCPNCRINMFPALTLQFSDPQLQSLQIWSHSRLTIHFCPSCSFYMTPYYLDSHTQTIIGGGRRNGGEYVNPYIETNYESRPIQLTTPPAFESDEAFNKALPAYKTRRLEKGVYHQIGGHPILGDSISQKCIQCDRPMTFGGILDYDDQTVPLYESNHQPTALVVGDLDSLNFYLCDNCAIVGHAWAKE